MHNKSFKKTILGIIICITLLITLCGCKKDNTTTLFKDEYELYDDNGVIKCRNYDYVVCLEKEKDKDFTILNFADVQLAKDDVIYENGVAKYAYELMNELITEVNPDLITLTGDQGYGEPESIKAISSVINKYNIPWAYVLGNHDNECSEIGVEEQINLYSTYSNCIAKYGPREITESDTGIPKAGNYIINIVEREEDGFKIVRSLFMLNTGNKTNPYDMDKRINNMYYDHLSDKQLEFYKWGLESSKKYNNGEYPKSTIIEHIPITAYAFAFAEAFFTDFSPYEFSKIIAVSAGYLPRETYDGSCWKEGYKDSFGVCYEIVYSSPSDDGIFEVIKQYGSTDSMLVGHDHINNFSINYQGVRLTYGLKTGYGSSYNRSLIGGTVLTVTDSSISFEHIYKKQVIN